MGIRNFIKRIFNKESKPQPKWVSDYYPLSMGITRTNGTAFACIDRIATEFALLNFGIFDAKTRQKVKRNPLYKVLKQPNLEDGHFNFFYQSAVDYFNGGCYWLKVKNDFGEVVSLFRLSPSAVSKSRESGTNEIIYKYNGATFSQDEIIYIPSRFGYSTLYGGQSIFSAVKETFDTAQSVETFTQSAFTNGVIGKRVVIDVSKAFPNATKEQIKELKDTWQSEYSGLENAGRPILKLNGFEYETLEGTSSTNNQSAELFENRRFQEHEIAKVFGVPEDLLTVSKDSKGANLENAFTLFSEFAVRPLAVQFAEAINSMLDEDKVFFDFDYNGIMKVALQQRIDSYTKEFMNGFLSINEIRQKENLEPVEAGDYRFVPANLMPLLEENVQAYMARQKLALKQAEESTNTDSDATDSDDNVGEVDNIDNQDDKTNGDHFAGGDDKQ